MTTKAVFLDKDGTLIENVPYNVDPAAVRLTPGAGPALQLLAGLGYRLLVVSNQPGIAFGRFSPEALRGVEQRIRELLAPFGANISGFYYCPHHPRGWVPPYALACQCRKPAPGLLLRAARLQGVALGRSWLIGDILDDIEAGKRAGCRTILLDVGSETEWLDGPLRQPDHRVPGLLEAAWRIRATECPTLRPAPAGHPDATERQMHGKGLGRRH